MFPLYSPVRWRTWLACTATAFALSTTPTVWAGIPATLTYQGHLTQAGGSPLTGTATLQVSLYTSASAGTALWSETHTNISVSNGVFAVQLGSITPLTLPFDTPYYLGVAVNGGTELLPRQPLSSAPYAFSANTVADGSITASKLGENCVVGETLLRNASGWACGVVAGPQGAVGPVGPTGPTGAQGAAGAPGSTGATGAQGATGPAGSSGAAGANALIQLTAEPAGIHCATGGTKVDAGSDVDGNNVLDASEVAVTRYVCDGAQGAMGAVGPAGAIGPQGPTGATGAAGPTGVAGPTGPAGATGPQGATGATGATGAAGPVGSAGNAGINALLKMTIEAAGANCTTGGVKVDAGNDANANGTLDAAEIVATRYVCHGTQGAQGVQGAIGPVGPAGPAGSGGGTTGLTTVVHGCFDGSAASASGTGYTVSRSNANYTISFTNAFSSASYSLLIDARTNTGRSRAITTTSKTASGTAWSAGWIDSNETQSTMCFVAAL